MPNPDVERSKWTNKKFTQTLPNPDVDQYLDTQKFTKNMPNPDVEQYLDTENLPTVKKYLHRSA